MKAVVLEMLEALLDAPVETITFLITFQSVSQIFYLFGERGISLFARLNEKFVLKFYDGRDAKFYDGRAAISFADCGGISPLALKRGEAVHIINGASEVVNFGLRPGGAVEIKPPMLKPVGFWRKRELRGVRFAAWLSALPNPVGVFKKRLS